MIVQIDDHSIRRKAYFEAHEEAYFEAHVSFMKAYVDMNGAYDDCNLKN